ncbi:MAG: hypothetical protein JRN26_01195 [Nitrososphaerota archaeon]|nr:hypothetical protein [Nitrososphaerota archaeon]MDG6935495.1 hypothetical protein [Nitrososphaerota archaeon]MDG6943523.1 hypothetical protein [Nitrososphaerota archaeon]
MNRSIVLGAFAGLTFWVATITIDQYALFATIIALLGLAAAIVWYIKGIETGKDVSIGVASGEE